MEDCGKIVVISILQFASLLGCCCHHLAWFTILSHGIHCHGDFFFRVDGAYRSKEYAHAIYCSISERSLVEFGKLLHAKPVGTSIVAIVAKVHLFEVGIFVETDVPNILCTTSLDCPLQDVVGLSSIVLGCKTHAHGSCLGIGNGRILLVALGLIGILEYPLPFCRVAF